MSSTSQGPQRISIVILGEGGTGKSCITMRLVRSQWMDEYDPTIEDSYSTTCVVDGETFELDIIDTAGQEEYRGLLSGLWQAGNVADAYLLVYDITNLQTLRALEEFDDLISNAEEINHAPHMTPPVKLVAGNKCDLATYRAVPSQQGLNWARRHGCGFMETSALMSVNIEETFSLMVRRVRDNRILEQKAREGERRAREELASQTAAAVGIPGNPYTSCTSDEYGYSGQVPVSASASSLASRSDDIESPNISTVEQAEAAAASTTPSPIKEKADQTALAQSSRPVAGTQEKKDVTAKARKEESGGCCIIL